MWYSELNSEGVEICIQKGIQRVLEERNLGPSKGLRLECPKPKCNRCVEKKNARSMLRLNDANHAKKRRSIAILNARHKEDVMHVL